MTKKVASLIGVTKSYPNGTVALSDATLDLTIGTTAIVGANGSGKSTLLSLIAGLIRPTKGVIQVLGEVPHSLSKNFRSGVGYSAQKPALDGEITGQESLRLFSALYGLTNDKENEKTQELIHALDLIDHLHKPIKTYSGGLKQKLHLTLSGLHRPRLWIMDEPTSALDPKAKFAFWSYLKSINDHTSSIVATHDLEAAQHHADNICILDDGKVIFYGPPKEIISKHSSIRWTLILDGKKAVTEMESLLKKDNNVLRLESLRNQLLISTENIAIRSDYFEAMASHKGLNLLEVHKRSPDLNTAYFEITGKRTSSGHGNNRKKT